MARIRLHLGNLNIAELITLGQQVHFATYGNASFASLKSEVDGLLDEINELIITNDGYQTALQLVQQRLAERQAQEHRSKFFSTNWQSVSRTFPMATST